MIDAAARTELEGRTRRAQELMSEAGLDGLLVSSEFNFHYFTGVLSQFFTSPTRPWFVLLPREGAPIAIVAETAKMTMDAISWIDDVRTWISPRPSDEGVTLVAGAIASLPKTFGRVGAELGPETRLGMPAGDFLRLSKLIAPEREFVDGSEIVYALRRVKSSAELDTLRKVCKLVSDGFSAVPELFTPGDSEHSLCKKLELHVMANGADKAPLLIACSGRGGYTNPVNSPSARTLERGDVLMIDAGFTLGGYFSDFNRNWAFGEASDEARRAYEVLYRATDAGIAAVRPGVRAVDVWQAMTTVLGQAGQSATLAGRLGHGLGLQVTELPSLSHDDETVLTPGMVITIEPGFMYDSAIMLHEEVVTVTHDGSELLTTRADPELPVIAL